MANEDRQNAGTRVPGRAALVHLIPPDDDGAAEIVGPLLHHVSTDATAPELLVVTPDAESAVGIVRSLGMDRARGLVPLTSAARGARLLARNANGAVAGPPSLVVELVRGSALKLDGVQTIVLLWADEIVGAGEAGALETVMAEVPKDAGRVLLASQVSPPVEDFIERYLRRAHRLGIVPAQAGLAPMQLSYALATPNTRRDVLRRVLDDLDPVRAAVFARTDAGIAEVTETLRALGYGDGDPAVDLITTAGAASASLIVLYEVPISAEQLRAVAGGAERVIALARPRDLPRLRAIVGGSVTPFQPSESADRARRREAIARDALRDELRRGIPDQQMLALEPLLDEFDGIEIAAAALRLRDRDRERASSRPPAEPPAPQPVGWTRLFLTTGTRDNVRAGDLVGMITSEGGITSDRIGKIELRENHSLVEVAVDVADRVVARINGAQVKGRRIVARLEREREPRGRGERERRGPGGPGAGFRPDRSARDGGRGERRPPRRRGNGEPPPSRA